MEAAPLDRAWSRGRTSLPARVARLRSKSWQIAQCAVAAGVAWFIAADLLGHQTPFFAPIAAVVSLGTSYGQRLRRVARGDASASRSACSSPTCWCWRSASGRGSSR